MESSALRRDTAWARSEENVEVVKRWIAAWNAGDMDTCREMLDPDVILKPAQRDSLGCRDIGHGE
jgi:hypothetical protein